MLKIWLTLILCTITGYSQEDSVSICIKDNDSEDITCKQQSVNYTFTQLSESVAFLNNCSGISTFYFYLTGGIHYLETNLRFNAEKVQIQGSSSLESTVVCTDASGIQFDKESFTVIKLTLVNCHKNMSLIRNNSYSIQFSDARFYNGSMDLVLHFSISESQLLFAINNCQFICESLYTYVGNVRKSEINITNSIFHGKKEGNNVIIKSHYKCQEISVLIKDTNFTQSGIEIYETLYVLIDNCSFISYKGTGITIAVETVYSIGFFCRPPGKAKITNSLFKKNARAIEMLYQSDEITIENCNFIDHYITEEESVVKIKGKFYDPYSIMLATNLYFQGNYNRDSRKCSVIYIDSILLIDYENLTLVDNCCTGITLRNSDATVYDIVNLTRNTGYHGALEIIQESTLSMSSQSQIYMINNTALSHGGGIYTDRYCSNAKCFFSISAIEVSLKAFIFSGNKAKLGGDVVYGGCLANCIMKLDGNNSVVNVTDSSNIFWEFTSADPTSDSSFMDEPSRVVFCDLAGDSHCSPQHSMNISIFRGQEFKLPLMAVDDYCSPSANKTIVARADQGKLWPEAPRLTEETCNNYSYFVAGNNITENFITINIYLQRNSFFYYQEKLTLTVAVKECPIGYHLNAEGACTCNNPINSILSAFNVRCIQGYYTLEIPAFMWIGRRDGKELAAKNCPYCHKESVEIILNDGDELCTHNRTGILCGKCIDGYSLPLSGDKCTYCRKSTLQGVLLSILILVIAVVVIVLLLILNLTISTGTLNALIFYSNVVYINSNEFLPINNNVYSKLQNVIRFLSSFQAWMNLDIGLSVCFFDDYNTYIHTWSQFTYPIYIWLLILLIVCASRYSRRLAKLTASNIVPVLATLLLLSYAKLFAVSINALSSSELHFIEANDINTIKVWELDGHIHYLQGKHIPLFLMSILMTVAYIIPFTLLVLLGPLLQAKSHHRLLSWINKLKPLMDAFYGHYSNRYRYWPGILLVARAVLFTTIALFDGNTALAAVSVVVIALLILWSLISQNTIAPYRNRHLNYLEYFFLFNLGCFSVMTVLVSRNSKSLYPQQVLAVIMTGSAFAVFCGIIMYHTTRALMKSKALNKIYKIAQHKIGERIEKQKTTLTQEGGSAEGGSAEGGSAAGQRETVKKCTHSTVVMTELREPLLTT